MNEIRDPKTKQFVIKFQPRIFDEAVTQARALGIGVGTYIRMATMEKNARQKSDRETRETAKKEAA